MILELIQIALIGGVIWGLWPNLKQRVRVARMNRRNRGRNH